MTPAPPKLPRATLLVLALLAACFAVEVLASAGQWKGLLAPPISTLVTLGGVVKSLVWSRHEWWRLVAGPLLHGDLLHLGLNALVLFVAGLLVERRVGPARWVVLYGLGASLGALGSALMNPDTTVSVGASGAGMALLAGLFVLSFGEPDKKARVSMQANALRFLVPSLLPIATQGDGMDLAAHVGGALAGFGFGFVLLREPAGQPFTWPARALAGAFALVTVAGIAFTAREAPAQLVASGQRTPGAVRGLLERACGLGSSAACVTLGGALATGEELERNLDAARALLTGPCERAGEAEACFFLGLTFHRAAPPRFPEAAAAYERACAKEELSACFNLAVVLPRMPGGADVEARVRGLLERACPAIPRACGPLAAVLASGPGAKLERALALAKTACEAKDGQACWLAGRLTRDDTTMARIFFEHACNLGDLEGCRAAADAWEHDAGGGPGAAKATAYLLKGCSAGEAESCFRAGVRVKAGRGAPADAEKAAGLFQVACAAGYAPACEVR